MPSPRWSVLVGEVVGRWSVLERDESVASKDVHMRCRCFCGKTRSIRVASLFSGRSKSCGCVPWNRGIGADTLPDRFASKVNRNGIVKRIDLGQCWTWTGATDRSGYGRIWNDGSMQLAHRVALRLAGVALPDDMDALHKCDNPPCCRPDHLFVGTAADNCSDMVTKGRAAIGNKNGTHTHPHRVPRAERHWNWKGRQ